MVGRSVPLKQKSMEIRFVIELGNKNQLIPILQVRKLELLPLRKVTKTMHKERYPIHPIRRALWNRN